MSKLSGKGKKSFYTPLNLTVSQGYIFQASRKRMIIWGSTIGLGFLAYFLFDAFYQKNSFISSGEISSNHANLEKKCSSCHALGKHVTDALCSGCHEKTSVHTIYDFKAHYLYRSNDARRVSQDVVDKYADQEMPCGSCHSEHQGKAANISLVSDNKCLTCHEYGSFNQRHPEFEFARTNAPDDTTLKMTHIRHTVFVLKEMKGMASLDRLFKTLKAETMDFTHFFEDACLYCHNPEPGGKNFTKINFEKHCAQCHIKADAIVAGLPKFDPMNPNNPGAETIAQMQFRGGPGLSWTYATNPNLTVDEDSEVTKSPIYHADPWIMENLKQIRKRLYPGNGLFDLLNTSGSVPIQRQDTLYSEAVRTLQSYADELQSRTELKGELNKINSFLQKARQKLRDPAFGPAKSSFDFPFARPAEGLTENQRADFLQLAFDLTTETGPECQKCHSVKNASILRVQADQNVLTRAEFNHRAHILEKRCTDCHAGILIDEKRMKHSVENYAAFKQKFPKTYKVDRSETQNIPKIKSCQDCHAKGKVSNRCVTCHKFHANKEHRSDLQMWWTSGR